MRTSTEKNHTYYLEKTELVEAKGPERTDGNRYLTFTAETEGSSVCLNWSSGSDVMYSADGGSRWADYEKSTTVTLAGVGDRVSFRGKHVTTDGGNHFTMSGRIAASGDVTSLTNGTGGDAALTEYCYWAMFSDCAGLTAAPELPATTLKWGCYEEMFSGCTGLTAAPELPAATMEWYCYNNMFSHCTSLTAAPELPAATMEWCCYKGMFSGCTGLTAAPELPATTLKWGCYEEMFSGCTSLTAAPELPATTLEPGCYEKMFSGCTSLTAAPELPETTLKPGCYEKMFSGCTSLTAAPELPANSHWCCLPMGEFEKVIEHGPAIPKYYIKLGADLSAEKRDYEASECLDRAISLRGYEASECLDRAISLRGYEASECLDRAIELDPERADAYGVRGNVFFECGNLDAAREDYTRAIYFAPDEAAYYHDRGNTYRDHDRNEEALEDYALAMELDPDEPEYLNDYGVALYSLGRYDEAINCFSKAAELAPEEPLYYSNRGNACMKAGETGRAIDDYKQTVSLDPDEPFWYISNGYWLAKAGSWEQASAYLAKAAGPGLESGHYEMFHIPTRALCLPSELGHKGFYYQSKYEYFEGLGDIMKALGKNKEAADYYTVAIDLAPNIPDIYKKRAEAYRTFRKKHEADSDTSKAKKLEKWLKNIAETLVSDFPAGKPDQQKTVNPTAAEIIRLLKENTSKKAAEMKFMKQRAPLTGSKLGGVPFIPEGGTYPTDAGTGDKLYLLLQINFEEMPPVPDFPQKGLLQIFIGAGDMYGCDFDSNQERWRILYHEDISRPMPRKEVLELMPGLPEDGYMLPFKDPESEYRIRFTGAGMPVSIDDFGFQQAFSTYCRDALPDELRDTVWYKLPPEIRNPVYHNLYFEGSRVGGYPAFVQGDPRGCRVPGNYELLLQVDSDSDNRGKSAVVWGDYGVANFFIDLEDLKKRDFSKVFYTWDCC